MTVAMLTVVVTLAAIPVAHAILRIAALALRSRPGDNASTRAGVLFLRGIVPTGGAVAIAFGLVVPAFVTFEPPHDGERVGLPLMLLAALGAVQILTVAIRCAAMLRRSRRITTNWRRGARVLPKGDWGLRAYAIDTGFPVVAVSGFVRPTLFVDRRVIAACSPGELAAIAAHERAHVRAWDNARRLLLGMCTGAASAAAAAWREAAEHAADTRAAESASRAVDLASALLKVARLAPASSFDATALSTIHDGGVLEARIHHLLAQGPAPRTSHPGGVVFWMTGGVAMSLAALNWTSLLSFVHAIVENAVRYLR